MSETYTSLINGLDILILDLIEAGNIYGKEYSSIENYLGNLWFNPVQEARFILKGEETKLKEFSTEFYDGRVGETILNIARLKEEHKEHVKWIDSPPNNWNFSSNIIRIYRYAVLSLKVAINPNYTFDFKRDILNVFFRLTNYNDGAMVPLRDLIDISFAKHVVSATRFTYGNFSKPTNDDLIRKYWEFSLEGIFFSLLCMKTDLPAPYYPGLAALEKKDTLTEALITLEQTFFSEGDKKE